ncbi:CoA-binding protein [Streptococcus macacae]|uniref:CoA binding domain protein n=1 Tax=Streptococcus macacae NCTC 11558 TaxID=764298 RepID=G5JW38_9STRE|nr:CoA-binding protein [Streptococcus macacae]EHJ51768.1 CoA binding domain protein [Streptococcus macacae NCTC 11558]SUN79374.1 putative CoA-binding protein [Streptococcus macacae NCTC 11558]
MAYRFQNPSQDTIFAYLKEAKTIAVVGLSKREETAAYEVAQRMQQAGYKIIPVNPRLAGEQILGETVYARLQDIAEHVDIVDVFRRSEFLADAAKDFIETDADVFWAQLGLESQEAEKILRSAGRHKIVMNKCLKIEYFKLK